MPELPEIETIRRGLEQLLTGRTLTGAVARVASLRRPLAGDLGRVLTGAVVGAVERRAKYLLLRCSRIYYQVGSSVAPLSGSVAALGTTSAYPGSTTSHPPGAGRIRRGVGANRHPPPFTEGEFSLTGPGQSC